MPTASGSGGPFAQFWNELRHLSLTDVDGTPKTTAAAGDVLHLKTSHIFGRNQDLRHVYVRQAYVDLVAIIMSIVATVAPQHKDATARAQVLIRGTPGIGKTVFLTFLLWSIIQQYRGKDITIVYRHGPTNLLAVMKLNSDVVETFTIDAKAAAPSHLAVQVPNNWVLLDACSHLGDPNSTAHTVMVTSPRADLYNDYAKFCSRKLWMPVWDWAELSDCRGKVFNDTVSQERLESVAEAAGQIPRDVFFAENKDTQKYVQQLEMDVASAIPKDLNQLTRVVDEVRASEAVHVISHRIVHLWTTDYQTVTTHFASPFVEGKTMDYLEKAQLNDIQRIMRGEGDDNLRTIIYERWAHVTLAMGGQQYKIKRLDGPAAGAESVVTFPTMQTRRFWNLKDFEKNALLMGEYAQPKSKILGAVDSLVKPDILFQMTVASDHGIKAALLEEAIDVIDPPVPLQPGQRRVARKGPPIRLYFVIPQKRWTTFRKQSYDSTGSHSHVLQPANIALEIRNRIEQWALLFPAE